MSMVGAVAGGQINPDLEVRREEGRQQVSGLRSKGCKGAENQGRLGVHMARESRPSQAEEKLVGDGRPPVTMIARWSK